MSRPRTRGGGRPHGLLRSSAARAAALGKLALLVATGAVAVLVLLLLFVDHNRAATVSGRSEVLRVRVPGGAFASWSLPAAEFRPDLDTPAEPRRVTLQLDPGAELRVVRAGRGPLRLDFTPPDGAPPCEGGRGRVGVALIGEAEEPVCDVASVVLRLGPDAAPLTLAVQGEITVGEAVRPGGANQPILLNGAVTVFLRPTGDVFARLCGFSLLRNACDRYEATSRTLAAGDEAAWTFARGELPATGFLRIDPAEEVAGFSFDIAAAATTLRVTRLKGEAFEVQESMLERMVRSPLAQDVGATAATLGALVTAIVALLRWTVGGSLLVVVVLLGAASARAEQVYLEAREQGQALLMARADRCQAVTLEHVVGRLDQEDRATEATLVAPSRVPGEAAVLRRIPSAPEPLVVLEARGPATAVCPAFRSAVPLDAMLRSGAAGQLRMVRRDGGVVLLPLSVQGVDFDVFLVRFGGAPARGMSGGTVLVDGRPAGLLADVDAETGIGRVARLDRVLERLAPWFAAAPVAAAPQAAPGRADGLRVEVVRWSVPPLRPAERAEGVLEGRAWRVAADRPAELVLRLPEGSPFSGLDVDVAGLPDPPRAVEVLTSPAGSERWLSAGVLALEPGDASRRLSVAPRRAGLVMLRLMGAQTGQSSMALLRVTVH